MDSTTLQYVSIHDEFTNSANLDTAGSVDRLLLGLINQPCQRRDEFITEEMTNHLFQTPGFPFGMDLASLNIQRGRDHGLPPYVRWREPCSLSPIRTFEDLNKVMSLDVIRKLKSLYSSVEDIDLFSAGLAEKSVIGGLVGPTFACIIAQQFNNLRRGDRFWYENPNSESSFTANQLQQIRQVTLAQVLCQTMDDIETVQPFVFLATDVLKNQRLSCDDLAIGHLNLEFWTEQLSEFKSNVDNSQKVKRAATDISFSISRLKEENIHPRRKVHPENNPKHIKITTLKSFQNSVNQENNIIVKRPLVRPNNNITNVIQNNAVNAPVFENEGIYSSNIKIQEQLPISSTFRPQGKPIPMTIPHSLNFYLSRQPYVPYTFNDPHNPNPLAYGYRLPPFIVRNLYLQNSDLINGLNEDHFINLNKPQYQEQ
ncbi:Peroxidasin [Atta colombica]|uniref:Peroxidasin n=1 Tax=Atta colombica TaxID=520822 RepID=A0A151HY71_9HYME|nr:Peroxidasin [Atta colombica]